MKVRVFEWAGHNGQETSLRRFENDVNNFLKRHKIVDVQRSVVCENFDNYFATGIHLNIGYIVKYEEPKHF